MRLQKNYNDRVLTITINAPINNNMILISVMPNLSNNNYIQYIIYIIMITTTPTRTRNVSLHGRCSIGSDKQGRKQS